MSNIKKITVMGMLIAIEVVLSRFLAIPTPMVKISFGFVPVAVMAMLFGPVWTAAGSGAADFIGAQLFPTGPYFPGFTLSTAINGAIFGILLYKRHQKTSGKLEPSDILYPAAASFFTCMVINLFLNTVWIEMILGKGYLALLGPRVIKELIMVPIQTIIIFFVQKNLLRIIK